MKNAHEVIVMGGGPAGTACGTFLAQAGLRVTILEGDRHPRHHIGESLLAASMPILQSLGVSMGEMASQFQPKFGARFYDPLTEELATFSFEPTPGSMSPSYQVSRESFDLLLSQRARAAGCDMEEGVWIEAVDEDAERPTVKLRDGRVLSCDFLVDASGKEPILATKRKQRQPVSNYGRVGIYNYFTDLPPHDDADADYITMYLFSLGWFWMIPLRDGRTSVGAVYRQFPEGVTGEGAAKTKALFWRAVNEIPRLEKRLRAAKQVDDFRAIGDYSFTVGEKFGEHWVAIGDAAGFLDPIFSSGVHLALSSAKQANAAILRKLQTGSNEGLTQYAVTMDRGYTVFRAFVHRFYNREMVRTLFFSRSKPPAIHAAITRILAGNVWDADNPVLKLIGVDPLPAMVG